MKAHVNSPPEVVVMVSPVKLPTEHPWGVKVTPPKLTAAPELNVKPVPETVNELPTGPWPGVTVIATGVTVNIVDAVFVPSEATIV